MQYLGIMSGNGTLRGPDGEPAPARYEFEAYLKRQNVIAASGEISLDSELLRLLFGKTDVELLIEDGTVLTLSFSDKQAMPAKGTAHVDVVSEIPRAAVRRHA